MPDSSINRVELKTPMVLKLTIILSILVILYLVNFLVFDNRVGMEFNLYTITTTLFIIISIRLHEYCHYKAGLLYIDKYRIIINKFSVAINDEIAVSQYRLIIWAPIASVALFSLIAIIVSILNLPNWFKISSYTCCFTSFLGMSNDFYWLFKLRNLNENWVVKDYGDYAHVYLKKQ